MFVLRMLTVLLVSSSLLSGCQLGRHYSDKNQNLEVDYYQQQCDKKSTSLCFRTREKSSEDWNVNNKLSGFSAFQWGNIYQLAVKTSFDSRGKAENHQFKSIKTTTASSSAFSLTLYTASGILTTGSDNSWILAGDKNFTCSIDQCAAIKKAVEAQEVIQLEFTAANNALSLNKVKCQSAEDSFDKTCEGVSDAKWQIASFQSDCNLAKDQKLCLVYRTSSSDSWELLETTSTDISGFTPKWGEEYSIDVTKTLSSGGQLTAATLKTNDASPGKKEGIGNLFKFVLQASELGNVDTDNKVTLYDGNQVMVCGNLCSTITNAKSSGRFLLLEAFVQESEIFVNKVLCDENGGSDFNQCIKDNHSDVKWWRWAF